MKYPLRIFAISTLITCIISCAKDEPHYCTCHDQDFLGGNSYYIDTVMASSSQEAKKECDKLDLNYFVGTIDCSGM